MHRFAGTIVLSSWYTVQQLQTPETGRGFQCRLRNGRQSSPDAIAVMAKSPIRQRVPLHPYTSLRA